MLDHVDWLAPKFIVLYVFVASVMYVHFRGRVRHALLPPAHRPLDVHGAVQRADVHVLGGAEPAVHRRRRASRSCSRCRTTGRRSATRRSSCSTRATSAPPRGTTTSASIRSSAAAGSASTSSGTTSRCRRRRRCARRPLRWCSRSPRSTARCSRCCRRAAKLGTHRDPFAGSLRYHLGLVTPNADSCRIFVDGEPYYWRDGEAVMFDETFIHWAENKSRRRRGSSCSATSSGRSPAA